MQDYAPIVSAGFRYLEASLWRSWRGDGVQKSAPFARR